MGEHGHWLKTTLFENAARVPLIVVAPSIENKGQKTSALAELVDLYPTLAELCGTSAPDCVSGVSLVPALKDPHARPRTSAMSQLKNNYTIRTEHYRYTEWGDDGIGGNELYSHENDPHELVNLANTPGHVDLVARLSKQLHERVGAARRPPKGLKQVPEPTAKDTK